MTIIPMKIIQLASLQLCSDALQQDDQEDETAEEPVHLSAPIFFLVQTTDEDDLPFTQPALESN